MPSTRETKSVTQGWACASKSDRVPSHEMDPYTRSRQCRSGGTRDAYLALRTKSDTWTIGTHITRNPGTGQGKRYRALIQEQLLNIADTHGITITATAATPELAERYQQEIPGLIAGRRVFPRRVALCRKPAPDALRHLGPCEGRRRPRLQGWQAETSYPSVSPAKLLGLRSVRDCCDVNVAFS
ncbi:hypothetical protein ACUXOQ_000559 [Dermabacter hominis]